MLSTVTIPAMTATAPVMAVSTVVDSRQPLSFPMSDPQLQKIRAHHTNLASTGCTKDFCQAGRAVHTDEPRIGENRPLLSLELEAQDFLQDLYGEGFYGDDGAFQRRLDEVLNEIRTGAAEGIVRSDQSKASIGGSWTQTVQELQFGVRRAWKNSRKCIMRSHCEELKLCDFRTITSSKEMAVALLTAVQEAFNGGSIQPTVFVFPPRAVNSRGPMILNHQILQFAGYEAGDGSIIGDPASVDLTKAVIDLGWEPPQTRGRWDLLPLVTMADGDRPHMAELPADIRKLVSIRHPQYVAEFEKLDLKWVAFPALTRLGFDIGGVQYTAAPFMGWFMDAEIGVRDLADTFRYNMLPEIVHALGMIKGRLNDEVEEFEDLPDYEKLALLSKAQAELNYAVHWSYLQAKVTMTDSLTASMKWCRYDDEFRQKNGFRLPADPYWLAPPQGSIIPLWHRGGAPNYQPRPMICKHLQDPVKAWGREKHRWYPGPEIMEDPLRTQVLEGDLAQTSTKQSNILIGETVRKSYVENPLPLHTAIKELICPPERPGKSIAIYFCSAGTVAERLANKLHKWIQRLIRSTSAISLKPRVEPLNSLKDLSFTVNRIILLVVSSTGKGDVPANGSGFVELGQSLLMSPANVKRDFRFAIFGNGDSRYSNTFNGAAVKIDTIMRQLGGAALVGGFCCGDTAVDPVPLGALKTWFAKLEPNVTEEAAQWMQKPPTIVTTKNGSNTAVTVSVTLIKEDVQRYDYCQQSLLSTLKDGSVISISPEMRGENPGSLLLTLSVRNESIKEMSCIQVLPINASSKVQRALAALNVDGSAIVDLQFPAENPNYTTFLTEFIDLELPFTNLYWLDLLPSTTHHAPTKSSLTNLPVLSVLETLRPHTTLTPPTIHHPLLLALPLLRTRTYSLASSPLYLSRHPPTPTTTIQILLKPLPTGRFSTVYLTTHPHPSPLKYRLLSSLTAPHLLTPTPTPTILIATGAGFGPVRAFLQHRIALAITAGRTVAPLRHSVSVFVGVKEADVGVVSGVICEALALDLVDVVGVVVSCGGRRRVGDEVLRCGKLVRGKIDRGGVVFVCANEGAARGVRGAVEKVIGVGVEGMGERYLEEVF